VSAGHLREDWDDLPVEAAERLLAHAGQRGGQVSRANEAEGVEVAVEGGDRGRGGLLSTLRRDEELAALRQIDFEGGQGHAVTL
jgi:hypothetical protein